MNSTFIHANYSDQVIEEYKGNPLIEALPPIYSKEEVIAKLSYYPMFNVSERELESHHRFHLIQRLFNIYQVFPNALFLNEKVGMFIRQGYVGRNPLKPEFARGFTEGFPKIHNGNQIWINDTSPKSMSIIGISGSGKTSTMTRILQCYPQVLVHSNYKGNPFSFTQLVWLQLNCPHDGSVKGLVNQFFISVDNILGTDYFDKFGRSNKLSVNTLMPIMTTVCRGIGLGFISIDEVQHLSLKGVGAKMMLNFFVTLSNILSIPICLIGTPSAMNVLQREFRQARRGGDMIFNRMENNAYWRLFIETIWNYQWVRKPVELTDDFINVLYEESQGIIDTALKVYSISQLRAIATNREELSIRLIKQVARENLKLIQPMLKALRSGDIHEMAKYEDIYFPYETAVERERIELEKNSFINATKAINDTVSKERLQEEAVFRLNLLGLSKETAKHMVKSVLKEKNVQDVNELARLAYQYSLTNVQENIKGLKEESSPNLRTIVKEGKEQGLSAYQSLKRAGIIKSLEGVV
ncbi:ATP-binding protein [Bacillus sp. APMAM]|nr:ATP-binding protein [Bacillus sp. APMAM]RTZ55318.1 ATP-binding protein [Bacillus sp. SAJ1]